MTRTWLRALALAALCGALVGCDDDSTNDAGMTSMDAGPRPTTDGGGDTDGGGAADGGNTDAGAGSDGGVSDDAGQGADAGAMCSPTDPGGACGGGLMCLCCPAGGPAQNCLCTTRCMADAECTDPARPVCDRPRRGDQPGICTPPMFGCAWGSICASPDTPILTPTGERRIDELVAGDLVLTMDEGELVPRALLEVSRTAVVDHAVVRVELGTGEALEISGGHPTADGRLFSDLAPGEELDGVRIEAAATVPYEHAFTHDILPDSDSGTYVAGGVLIGSTLSRN